MHDNDIPGEKLRKEREDAKVSLNDLARAMGKHRSTVWRYEGLASVEVDIVNRYRDSLAKLTKVAA